MRTLRPISLGMALAALLIPVAAPGGDAQEPKRIAGSERVQVNLVLIDVVVRDRKDRPVSGLTRGDFELLVDRLPTAPSDIESFEEICPSQPAPTAGAAPTPAGAPPAGAAAAATATATPATEPRRIVVFLDFSQLSFSGRRQALKSARDYLAGRLQPDDRVMILAFKKDLRLVQDFTTDSALLTSRLDEMMGDNTTLDTNVLEEGQQLLDVARRPCDADGAGRSSRRALAATYAAQEEMRARRTLHAIESLMPALAGIRGRKALVLFSDTLRDEPGVEYVRLANSTPKENGINLEPDLLRLTREANAASVSIYTVHASGLDDSAIAQFRDAKPDNVGYAPSVNSVGRTESGGSVSETFEAARTGLDSALALQVTMATETGGQALQRTNDVGSVLGTATQDLSCYYLIGYKYEGRGDDRRHSILIKLNPDAAGDPRRGLTLRYRPYYTDVSPDGRRESLVRSALEAPDLYRAFSISAEAFALAPQDSKRRVLIKAIAPLDAFSLVPAGETSLEGRAMVRGEVTTAASGATVCEFSHEFPVKAPRDTGRTGRLIFETGCLLEPGAYDLALAMLDPASQEAGARRSTLVVQPAGPRTETFVSDVGLWAREPGAVVVAAGVAAIGMKDGDSPRAFVPRSERRLRAGEEALLSFLFCPATGTAPTPERPVRVRRTLLGEGDAAVASFRDLAIAEAPDPDTGCYQIVNAIPANTLGEGVYRFAIQMTGPSLGGPVTREAALAVD